MGTEGCGRRRMIERKGRLLCPHCLEMIPHEYLRSSVTQDVKCIFCDSMIRMLTAPREFFKVGNERRDPRLPVRLEVSYEDFTGFYREFTRNLSRGGMCMVTERPHEIGTVIAVDLHVPELPEPISLTGEIVHRDLLDDQEGKPGVGVRFTDISEESRVRLMQYLAMLAGRD